MKLINKYIAERLKLGNKGKDILEPQTREELIDIIKDKVRQSKKDDIIDLNDIDVSNITDFNNLFAYSLLINRNFDVTTWDVSNGRIFNNMFKLTKFDGDLAEWDMKNAVYTNGMFQYVKSFTGKGLDRWKLPNVIKAVGMFSDCDQLNVNLSELEMNSIKDCSFMFYGCCNLETNFSKWNIDPDKVIMQGMFDKCIELEKKKLIPSWYENN